jgi:diguanylate cyclase (GGDEF)-like protein
MFSPPLSDDVAHSGFRFGCKSLRLPFRLRTPNGFMAIGIALVLAIGVGDAVVIAMQRGSEIAAYETGGSNLSRGMSAQTAKLFEVAGRQLADIEKELAIAELAGPEQIAAALREAGAEALLSERINWGAQARPSALLDASGKVVASRMEELDKGSDSSDDELFRRLRSASGPDVIVGAPRRNRDGQWNFHMARRLKGADKAFAGAALLQLSAREFEDFYRIAMPPHREVTVMTGDGTLLIHYPPRDGLVGSQVEPPASLGIRAQECSAFDGPDVIDKATVVAVLCRLGVSNLILETSASEEAVLAPWRSERLWLILGGAATALAVVGLLGAFARQMDRLETSELSLAVKSQQLETARSQLEIALSNIAQGVSFLDANQRLVFANDRYLELYGLAREDVAPGVTLAEILRLSDARIGFQDLEPDAFAAAIERAARDRAPGSATIAFRNGRILSVQRKPLADGGWVATHEDVTERRRAEEKISFLAKHDPLTGLVNRSVLVERLLQVLERPSEQGFAILFLDLDRFKAVNDSLGHAVGDELLRQVADRMAQTVRARDTVARFGGDEFVVLQTDVRSLEDVTRLAQRLIEVTAAPYRIGPYEIEVGASVGIEATGDASASPDALIRRADLALYASKSQGRGVYSVFAPHMDPQSAGPSSRAQLH